MSGSGQFRVLVQARILLVDFVQGCVDVSSGFDPCCGYEPGVPRRWCPCARGPVLPLTGPCLLSVRTLAVQDNCSAIQGRRGEQARGEAGALAP